MTQESKPAEKAPEDRTILINFLLDKSGSMGRLADAAASGFNEFRQDRLDEPGRALMTFTLFDTRCHTVAEAVPVREIVDLDSATYRPGGMTALLDAIGHTMRITDDFVDANDPDQVLFVILSDGFENASREFTRQAIGELIANRQESRGYEFLYMGANQDSFAVASDMGIRDGRSLDWVASPDAIRESMARSSRNVKAYRNYGEKQVPEMFSGDFETMADLSGEQLRRHKEEYLRSRREKRTDASDADATGR